MRNRQANFTCLALLLAGLALAGAEGTARWYEAGHASPDVDFGGGFAARSRVFAEVPGHPGKMRTAELKRLAFVDQLFPRAKAPGAFRVAVLGESSVNYLQKDLWEMKPLLAHDLGLPAIEIINAGGKSYGSQRLALVARELRGYAPDVLVLYLGHNEFEEVEQFYLIRPRFASLLDFFYGSALVRVATGALLSARLEKLRAAHAEKLLESGPDVARAWTYPFTDRDVKERMQQFEANLRAIVELYRGSPTKLILSTIPSNYIRPELPPAAMIRYGAVADAIAARNFAEANRLGHEILRTTAGRHQSSDLENEILRRVAADYKLPLVDVVAAVEAAEPHHISGETLFRDHCHLNDAGNALLAGLLEKAIVQVERTPTAAER